MAKGYLFGLGFFLSLASLVVLFIGLITALRKVKPKKVKMSQFKKYLDKIIEEQKYEEADFINKLIYENIDEHELELPKGYSLKSKKKFKFNKNGSIQLRGKTRIIKDEDSANKKGVNSDTANIEGASGDLSIVDNTTTGQTKLKKRKVMVYLGLLTICLLICSK